MASAGHVSVDLGKTERKQERRPRKQNKTKNYCVCVRIVVGVHTPNTADPVLRWKTKRETVPCHSVSVPAADCRLNRAPKVQCLTRIGQRDQYPHHLTLQFNNYGRTGSSTSNDASFLETIPVVLRDFARSALSRQDD